MRVVGWIFAILLLLLGGGCSVLFVAASDGDFIGIWLLLGLLPLVAGSAIIWTLQGSVKAVRTQKEGGEMDPAAGSGEEEK
jgi:hypothetical protein